MKSILKLLVAAIFIGAVSWTLYYLYKKTFPPPPPVKTECPSKATIIKKAVAVGSIIPRKEVDIKPRVSGVVEEIVVKPGDMVKTGDVLARIKIIPNMNSLREAELRVSKSKLGLEDATKTYERKKELFEAKVIPEKEFQQYDIEYRKSADELEAAKDSLTIIKEGIYGKSEDTSTTIIRSTIDGMILAVPITLGKSVTETNNYNEGTTIATVADMTQMLFKGKIDESDVGRLQEGLDVVLSVGALDAEKLHATLEHISPKGVEDRGSTSFEIKAAVKLKESCFVRSGYSATAEIVLDKRDDVLSIPETHLQFKDGKPSVDVEKGPGVFESRQIETGLSDGIRIEVVSGLTEKDKIRMPPKVIPGK